MGPAQQIFTDNKIKKNNGKNSRHKNRHAIPRSEFKENKIRAAQN